MNQCSLCVRRVFILRVSRLVTCWEKHHTASPQRRKTSSWSFLRAVKRLDERSRDECLRKSPNISFLHFDWDGFGLWTILYMFTSTSKINICFCTIIVFCLEHFLKNGQDISFGINIVICQYSQRKNMQIVNWRMKLCYKILFVFFDSCSFQKVAFALFSTESYDIFIKLHHDSILKM